jgi:hypothetical protein
MDMNTLARTNPNSQDFFFDVGSIAPGSTLSCKCHFLTLDIPLFYNRFKVSCLSVMPSPLLDCKFHFLTQDFPRFYNIFKLCLSVTPSQRLDCKFHSPVQDIPLFYNLFNSGSPSYRAERVWMLRLLAAGLMTSADGRVFRRRFVLELLMSFAGSAMADAFTRRLVMQVSIGCESVISQATTPLSLL